MPRVKVNGVIWNKAQDNILKVGVLRYGQNQWERIIPLLPGKTVKQCKDRWEIGLDRSIRKNEWTTKEDCRLLRLAILMPAKWRDIASIIRRTVADCFNRYDHLLNEARKKEEEADVLSKELAPRRSYNNPNIKPTGTDEKRIYKEGLEVMLSEARAKLATTQAKKAKFLAREKRSELARRFTYVQRQRERIRAKIRAEAILKMCVNLDTEISADSQSPSCFYYSSSGHVDPLAGIFLEMQQRSTRAELGPKREEKEEMERIRDDREVERLNKNCNSVQVLLANEEPSTNRRKVVVVQEPAIAYRDWQQAVVLRKYFGSTGNMTCFDRFLSEMIVKERCAASIICSAQKGSNDFNQVECFRKNNNHLCI